MADNKGGAPKDNQNSTTDKRLVTNTLRRITTQDPDKLRKACEAVLEKAMDGDIQAFREITDRLEGKAIQAIEGTGNDGEFIIRITANDESTL